MLAHTMLHSTVSTQCRNKGCVNIKDIGRTQAILLSVNFIQLKDVNFFRIVLEGIVRTRSCRRSFALTIPHTPNVSHADQGWHLGFGIVSFKKAIVVTMRKGLKFMLEAFL